MRQIRELAGLPQARKFPTGFATLLRIIASQQVSAQSGAAIWERLNRNADAMTPEGILNAGEDLLRKAGFSGAKARYGLDLAQAVLDGMVDLEKLPYMSNRRVEKTLVQVKGIGRWTAEIYLMFALGRADIWPASDLAVAEATRQLLGLSARPGPAEMDEIGERWRPWRSTATLMLWHYYGYSGKKPV